MKTTDNFADLTLNIKWNTPESEHKDIIHMQRVNIFRDFLYEHEPELLFDREKKETVKADKNSLESYFSYNPSNIFKTKKNEMRPLKKGGQEVIPLKGRFYPRGILGGINNVFSVNMHPFRCLDIEGDTIFADFNNPLSGKSPEIDIKIENIIKKEKDSGASCRHLLEENITGPGMQARFNSRPTDFFSGNPFERKNNTDDKEFYEKPRITAHADALCRKHLENIYSGLIKPDSKVLDLMASVYSHLPENNYLDVTGLGLNMDELSENKALSEKIIQDINTNTKLPFEDETFDYITCAMSVEYMTKPFEIFKEALRVLRKNGLFIISFSNRWFPGKEINIWSELHDFEKMGLILEYFHVTKGFKNLNTVSMRGFPRPYDKTDRYKDTLWFSDPLYVVYGQKI